MFKEEIHPASSIIKERIDNLTGLYTKIKVCSDPYRIHITFVTNSHMICQNIKSIMDRCFGPSFYRDGINAHESYGFYGFYINEITDKNCWVRIR